MNLPVVTASLRLVADPQARVSAKGNTWVTFRGAANSRKRDPGTGDWVDGDTTFLSVKVLDRRLSENIVEADLRQGDIVVVSGELEQREYEQDGAKRTVYELVADEVGISLRVTPARILRKAPGVPSGAAPSAAAVEDDPPF